MMKKGHYDLGGRALYAEMHGSGAPMVVIEVGGTMAGTSDPGWIPIRQALARQTSVFLYDRSNLGRSDPDRRPRSLNDFAGDLHAVLQAAQAEPPYVLVGCSLGGMIVTHYASLHTEYVQGILLLDPPHPEVNLRTLAVLTPERPDEPTALASFRQVAWQEQYAPLEAPESEAVDYQVSILQAQDTWNLRDIPLVVLTAGIDEWEAGFPPEAARAYDQVWTDLQKAYAALSTRSRHIVVDDSDHVIHDRRPELVLEMIRGLLS
jgi:pimeloyl-ACP methyl ester carboxylesterase